MFLFMRQYQPDYNLVLIFLDVCLWVFSLTTKVFFFSLSPNEVLGEYLRVKAELEEISEKERGQVVTYS